MSKIIISVAPVSANDNNIIPEEIANDVFECYKLGASMVHLHARDKNGKLTSDLSLLEETVRLIRNKCDIVIEISTGGVSELTIEERCAPCYSEYVEANSLNVGSVNLGKSVYINQIDDVEYCVRKILENGKRPEVEVFELGMINTMKELDNKYHFIKPILFSLVFGHEGEMPATSDALRHMVEYLYECFPDRMDVLWGYTQANRKDWNMMEKAIKMGASSVRIGFEDSDYISSNTKVGKNSILIEKMVEIIHRNGHEVMTSAELRKTMHIN